MSQWPELSSGDYGGRRSRAWEVFARPGRIREHGKCVFADNGNGSDQIIGLSIYLDGSVHEWIHFYFANMTPELEHRSNATCHSFRRYNEQLYDRLDAGPLLAYDSKCRSRSRGDFAAGVRRRRPSRRSA